MIYLSHEGRAGAVLFEFHQRRKAELGGVQRLQQIVADEGEKGRFEGIGLIRRLLGALQSLVGALHRTERGLKFIGAPAHGLVERDGDLEEAKGVVRLVHGAFDPRHQRRVDLAKLHILQRQPLEFRCLLALHPADRFPIATPAKVWLRCMVSNCSP